MIKNCEYCKKEYIAASSKRKYCTKVCAGLSSGRDKKHGKDVICSECCKIFYKRHSVIRKLNFCCMHCLGKYTSRINPETTFKKITNPKSKRKYLIKRVNGKIMNVHRLIMEEHIGRKLTYLEHVHHINGDTLDNRIENLQILSQKEHGIITAQEHKETWGHIKKKS